MEGVDFSFSDLGNKAAHCKKEGVLSGDFEFFQVLRHEFEFGSEDRRADLFGWSEQCAIVWQPMLE